MKKWTAWLLAAALLAALCACGSKAAPAGETTAQSSQTTETTAETTKAATTASAAAETASETAAETASLPELSGVVGDTSGYYYEIENNTGTYTDGAGGENTYSYAMPAFNVDSADASQMNAEIESFCRPYIDEMQAAEQDKTSLVTSKLSYAAYQNGDILSIVLEADAPNDVVYYKTFNLNVKTGSRASGKDLIAAADMTAGDFTAAAQKAASDKFVALYGSTTGNDFIDEQYAKTMSADAFSLNMPMYLDGSGKLTVIVTIYAMAGADSYDYPLVLG